MLVLSRTAFRTPDDIGDARTGITVRGNENGTKKHAEVNQRPDQSPLTPLHRKASSCRLSCPHSRFSGTQPPLLSANRPVPANEALFCPDCSPHDGREDADCPQLQTTAFLPAAGSRAFRKAMLPARMSALSRMEWTQPHHTRLS